MDHLYPNLFTMFKNENLCPICMMEMDSRPRYTCTNDHAICYRCKPYYYNCPNCQSPLEMQATVEDQAFSSSMPDDVPHSLPATFFQRHPNTPPVNEFQNRERNWMPPNSPEHQELKACSYAEFGCWVKLPIYLTDLHESRCQFRPHLEEERLPTDVAHKHENLVDCKYKPVGCKVVTSPWRIAIHQNNCIYRDSGRPTTIHNNQNGDPNELVECRYRKYGCMVNMPRRRKQLHQENCNYRKYDSDDDSDEQIPQERPCKWAEYGCRVRCNQTRLNSHEMNCNYRRDECTYKDRGCTELFEPPRRYAHERNCQYR